MHILILKMQIVIFQNQNERSATSLLGYIDSLMSYIGLCYWLQVYCLLNLAVRFRCLLLYFQFKIKRTQNKYETLFQFCMCGVAALNISKKNKASIYCFVSIFYFHFLFHLMIMFCNVNIQLNISKNNKASIYCFVSIFHFQFHFHLMIMFCNVNIQLPKQIVKSNKKPKKKAGK